MSFFGMRSFMEGWWGLKRAVLCPVTFIDSKLSLMKWLCKHTKNYGKWVDDYGGCLYRRWLLFIMVHYPLVNITYKKTMENHHAIDG